MTALAPPLQGAAALQRLRRTTVALFFVFLALVSLAGLFHLDEQYRSTVDETKRAARASVRTAESFASRTFAETYRVLEGVGDLYSEQLKNGRFDEAHLHQVLASKAEKLPYVSALLILDSERRNIAAARVFPANKQPIDRVLQGAGQPTELGGGLLIGNLYSSERHAIGMRQFYLPVGVKIEQDGKVIGYAVAILQPDFFNAFFAKIDVGTLGSVELWRDDGILIAVAGRSSTAVGDADPRIIKHIQTFEQKSEGAQELVYAVSDGYSRKIQATERIATAPMSVFVSLDGDDYLKMWRESRDRIGFAILTLIIAMGGTGIFIFSQLQRSELNEKALRQAKAAAEEANDAKSRFLAHMSHEFRTPLNAIMGFSEIIKSKVLGDGVSPVYVSYADHIHKSGEHLLNIVNDILDVAKIESGIQPLNTEELNILGVIEAAATFVDRLASDREMHISISVPVNLPFVKADERYLRQVLINLLTNAVKFSAPGQDIVIEARQHSKGMDIIVCDQGPGIDESIMRRIGERFLQSNPSVTRAGQGAGLGLSICKQYMEMLGGELLINSDVATGTAAMVRFPPSLLSDTALGQSSAAE
jgi:signal transduction histidine kinase